MTDRPDEPPLSLELPEMIQRAADVDDPHVYRLCDVLIRARLRAKGRSDLQRELEHDPKDAA